MQRQTPRTPEEISTTDRAILAAYWRSRGEGEMGAARYFQQVLEDFAVLQVPAPLVQLAERAQRDEVKHGYWGRDWSVFFGHEDTSDPVAQRTRPFALPGAGVRENRILRAAFCAMTETVGCHVLSDVRPRISYAPLRRLNKEHLSDELVHARIGWGFLTLLDASDRALVRNYVPTLLRLLPMACCDGPESDDLDHLIPWGYFTPSCLHTAHQRALREVILPGLEHLDLISPGTSLDALGGQFHAERSVA